MLRRARYCDVMQPKAPPMKAIWERLHTWLRENAPAGYGDLRLGASAEAIRAAERAMGLKLPADIKASYRIHDGQSTTRILWSGCLRPPKPSC